MSHGSFMGRFAPQFTVYVSRVDVDIDPYAAAAVRAIHVSPLRSVITLCKFVGRESSLWVTDKKHLAVSFSNLDLPNIRICLENAMCRSEINSSEHGGTVKTVPYKGFRTLNAFFGDLKAALPLILRGEAPRQLVCHASLVAALSGKSSLCFGFRPDSLRVSFFGGFLSSGHFFGQRPSAARLKLQVAYFREILERGR